MRKATSVEAAWAAGVIDGEGCIMVSANPAALTMAVAMCHRATIERLAAIFEVGTVTMRTPKKNPAHRPYWLWYCSPKAAVAVLTQTMKYMVTKRADALLAIEWSKLPKGQGRNAPVPEATLQRRLQIRDSMIALKGRIRRQAAAHEMS